MTRDEMTLLVTRFNETRAVWFKTRMDTAFAAYTIARNNIEYALRAESLRLQTESAVIVLDGTAYFMGELDGLCTEKVCNFDPEP